MNELRTFPRGGVHPQEHKLSSSKEIVTLTLPANVRIPLSQHLGAPSSCVVKKGDKVKVGTLIAKANGHVSANVHSSVSGTVSVIAESIDVSGHLKEMVFINVEGDEWEESIDRTKDLRKEISKSKDEIIEAVKNAGIVGLGGATFPTHVKLMVPPSKKAMVLVINGVECEPYLTSDHRVMLERTDEILVGIKILMKALDVEKCIVGIEKNKQDAINHFKNKCKEYLGITVYPLKVMYPQGAEKQLIDAVLSREVPARGGLPIDIGVVVQNVGTALAVYEAVQKNKPLVDRVVTLTGKAVENPTNYLVRIGTSILELIDASGGLPDDTGKIISGGPMMGKALTSVDVPVTKGTSGILIVRESESKRAEYDNCIRCAKCVFACPLGIEPYYLYLLSSKRKYERLDGAGVMSCCECGSCQYICPASLPLLDYIRLGKSEVIKQVKAQKIINKE